MSTWRATAIIFGLALLALVPLSAAAQSRAERAFLDAYTAYRHDDLRRLEQQAPYLKGYLLEPYFDFWRLELQLDGAPPQAVRAFLDAHRGSYLAQELRADWLRELGKHADWDRFEQELPGLLHRDLTIRCYAWTVRIARGDTGAYAEARDGMWQDPYELPRACVKLSEEMVATGQLSVADVWRRVRLLLWEDRLRGAERVIAYLPRRERPSAYLLRLAARAPRRLLDHLPRRLASRRVRETYMFALARLAREDPDAAADKLLDTLGKRLRRSDAHALWAFVATEAARDHDPAALAWYARAGGNDDLSDEQLRWKVRAALRAGDWRTVRSSIDAMSRQAMRDPAWTYWYARALSALGELRGAHAYYLMISDEPDFYGILATEALGYSIALPRRTYAPSAQEVAAAGRDPGLERALELYRLDLRPLATPEWIWAIRGMSDRQLLAAAVLALHAKVFDRAINTADKTTRLQNYGLRYLMPFRNLFNESARACHLDEAWVLGLVRQESRFIVDARSSAGARGLMQLMPRTARWVARKIGLRYRRDEVAEARTNITLGTNYLKLVLDDLGYPVLASAAYNAGPRRAARWCGDKPMEGAIYVETIPFRETRNYVKRVMANTVFYAALLGEPYISLKERLGTIPSKSAERPDGLP